MKGICGESIFDGNGEAREGVISTLINNSEFIAFQLKITGFTQESKNAMLAFGAYVTVSDGESTEYSFMQAEAPNEGANYYFTSYNEILSYIKK